MKIQQIKVFIGSVMDNEREINNFLKQNPEYEINNIFSVSLHDLFYTTGNIANQWIETTVVYKREINNE